MTAPHLIHSPTKNQFNEMSLSNVFMWLLFNAVYAKGLIEILIF